MSLPTVPPFLRNSSPDAKLLLSNPYFSVELNNSSYPGGHPLVHVYVGGDLVKLNYHFVTPVTLLRCKRAIIPSHRPTFSNGPR
jgi:hypothetical protein